MPLKALFLVFQLFKCIICNVIAGFLDKNITFELPDIEHINEDGRLPRMNITMSEGHSSITFVLCEREATDSNISLELEFPFIVLTNQVCHSVFCLDETFLSIFTQAPQFAYYCICCCLFPNMAII